MWQVKGMRQPAAAASLLLQVPQSCCKTKSQTYLNKLNSIFVSTLTRATLLLC
jgi:hypothetical protein